LNAVWRLGGSTLCKTQSNRQKAFKSIQENTDNMNGSLYLIALWRPGGSVV
jgi:hypothetical protein